MNPNPFNLVIECTHFQVMHDSEMILDFWSPYFRINSDLIGSSLLTTPIHYDRLIMLVNGVENRMGTESLRAWTKGFLSNSNIERQLSRER